MRQIEACLPGWNTQLALYIEKPHTAAILSLLKPGYDECGFSLEFEVLEVFGDAESIDSSKPFRIACTWNQPYMSTSQECINAGYCFTLYFGDEGVSRARDLWSSLPDEAKTRPDVTLFRSCFDIRRSSR
jgi:hypothetical protein